MKQITLGIFFIFMLFFTGCSSKRLYNQTSGSYLDTRMVEASLKQREINTKEFQKNEMRKFYLFAKNIYMSILKKIDENKKYEIGSRQRRDIIIYKENEEPKTNESEAAQ